MLEASIGAPQRHHHLTVFPVVAEKERTLPYLLLSPAVASGLVTIREVGQGTVPTLEVVNKGVRPVLILDGEQLLGARQNRMTSRSILLAPESSTPIPVSCMEQGRWHFVSPEFRSAPQNAPSKVRAKTRQAESRAAARGRSSHRDLSAAQGAVWEEIRSYEEKLESRSDTGALDALYAKRADDLERWIAAFPPVDRQIGLLAFVGMRVLGLDAVGCSGLYAQLHRRILTGYVMDAMVERCETPGAAAPGETEALQFVALLREARRVPSETVGLGEYRVLQGKVLGGELVHEGRLAHLSAFPQDEGISAGEDPRVPEGAPIRGPRGRRRR